MNLAFQPPNTKPKLASVHKVFISWLQLDKDKDYVCVLTQSCLTPCCSLPGSSVHGILQARILEWVYHFLLQRNFPTQGPNLHLSSLLHWPADSLPLHHLEQAH